MDLESDYGPIMALPDEIIAIILQNLKCQDIIHFGATCKQFNEFVMTNQCIWKAKFREILPRKISSIVEEYGDESWYDEVKKFYNVKNEVYQELLSMSPKYYWWESDIMLEDVRNFFRIALTNCVSYYYVLNILQDVVIQGTMCVETHAMRELQGNPTTVTDHLSDVTTCSDQVLTLTGLYYAKIVIRYLTQSFLTVKWSIYQLRHELTPDIVLNFFVQWTDTVGAHSDEDVRHCIDILIRKVEAMFPNDEYTVAKGCYNIKDKLDKGLLKERQVLAAISDVIFKQHRMENQSGASLFGLDLVKVFRNRCGNLIVTAVIYQTVARGCGVHCELVAFPNHLFLEWRSRVPVQNSFKICLETGDLIEQGRCPFAPSAFRKQYSYSPESFLQYIVSAFLMTMGAIRNWYTQNAVFLLDFLSNNISNDNPYRNFVSHLDEILDFDRCPDLNIHLELEYLPDAHLKLIESLSNLNPPPPPIIIEPVVGKRNSTVTFAVGMLAYHNRHDFLCVVRGWDLNCIKECRRRIFVEKLEFGLEQPFYRVVAVDQSERYVAQENLIPVDRPTRLYHLEDVISKEFSYFDGFCYVPNSQKESEYPEDGPIRDVYRTRAELKTAELRKTLLK